MTTQVSRYQKGKTNLDFTEARDTEWQWHQLGHMQVCTSLQTDNHASTPPLCFYRPDALPVAQPTASKHWRQTEQTQGYNKYCANIALCKKKNILWKNILNMVSATVNHKGGQHIQLAVTTTEWLKVIQLPAKFLRCCRPASTNAKQARKNTRTNAHRSTANGSSPTPSYLSRLW